VRAARFDSNRDVSTGAARAGVAGATNDYPDTLYSDASAGRSTIACARTWRATNPSIQPRSRAEVGHTFGRAHARFSHARHI